MNQPPPPPPLMMIPPHLTPEAVASLPPPGLSGPTGLQFSPNLKGSTEKYLAFVSSSAALIRSSKRPPSLYRPLTDGTAVGASSSSSSSPPPPPLTTASSGTGERQLLYLNLSHLATGHVPPPQPLLHPAAQAWPMATTTATTTEGGGGGGGGDMKKWSNMTQLSWVWQKESLQLLLPSRGTLWMQSGVQALERILLHSSHGVHSMHDPQWSPDGRLVAYTMNGDIYVQAAVTSAGAASDASSANNNNNNSLHHRHIIMGSHPIRLTYAPPDQPQAGIRHGVADFVAQEEMDRYRGFWWHPNSAAILFAKVDESRVPLVRILHHDDTAELSSHHHSTLSSSSVSSSSYEDHRYPFAGKENPIIQLGFIQIDVEAILAGASTGATAHHDNAEEKDDVVDDPMEDDEEVVRPGQAAANENWSKVVWWDPPREAPEYLARVYWLPDGAAVAQWQNRSQTIAVWMRMDFDSTKARTLLVERSEVWINLHHNFKLLPRPIHPDECGNLERNHVPIPAPPLPPGSFSFLYTSERSGFAHVYLYTYCPGINGDEAVLLRTVSAGEWMVESILAVDLVKDAVYFTGTYDSPLERHLYALPITNRRLLEEEQLQQQLHHVQNQPSEEAAHGPNGVRRGLSKVMNAFAGSKSRFERNHEALLSTMRPSRITVESGMHSIVFDEDGDLFVDTSSDLDRPTSVKVFALPDDVLGNQGTPRQDVKLIYTIYDAVHDDKSMLDIVAGQQSANSGPSRRVLSSLPAPELLSFPTADGSETLHAAMYRPDSGIHGSGPYPLICAVYGGPHVQRVNRSWSQCVDMRAQRLRSLGFCVVKCDNRGSSRRGLAFESAIARRLGRLEVLDQVAVVRQLVVRGIADAARVGVYGWSYGGYLSVMCLCRAPDVFHVAVAGAPVTSWDGYDTHYTERYMGLPSENPAGFRESAVFDHIPNMRGKLMIVHGLIDENVHFRHTARLINKLIAAGKDYDLLIFPDERHSPRRLRDRIYMEQRISDYFLRYLGSDQAAMDLVTAVGQRGNIQAIRNMAGHL